MLSQASPARKESSEVEQRVLEMSLSLPSSSSGRFSSAIEDPSTKIQVIISPDPNQSHAHTLYKDASTVASLQDENTGVNGKTPPVDDDLGISKEDLRLYAVWDDWDEAKSTFDAHPHMVRTSLTGDGDTALHIAVGGDSVDFVQQLVNLVHMTPKDLEIRNSAGYTAFCLAAISGNARLLKIMMYKNDNLPLIPGHDGMLPVHLAASSGHREIVRLLSSDDLLGKMKHNDIERLFFMTITSDIFDVAIKLFGKYRDLLTAVGDDVKLTALHILAKKPSEFSGTTLFRGVWDCVGPLDYSTMSELLLDAIKSRNDGAARLIIEKGPRRLLALKDSIGRSPLHYAALYRRESVLRYILKRSKTNHIIRAVDSEGNNVLHLAASYQPHEALSRLDTIMQRELTWFKELENRFPMDLVRMKNNEGKTPKDIFYDNHKELSKEVKETVKGIGNSGMLVAALIATVAFAAALTVPGDKTSAWFVVFILTNTVALFASSASIISFLSIFTSAWVTDKEFIISQTLINLGLVFLVVSVVSMVLSFAAASFLIFGHIFKWVAYVVVSMGILPTLSLLVLRSQNVDLLHDYFDNRLHSDFSGIRDCGHHRHRYFFGLL